MDYKFQANCRAVPAATKNSRAPIGVEVCVGHNTPLSRRVSV